MDLEQIRRDFKDGKMISKCTWALVLEATKDMEATLSTIIDDPDGSDMYASNCLGRVAAL